MARKKGPTWAEIHREGANNIEARNCTGVLRRESRIGKSLVVLRCPFCTCEVYAYVWSLPNGKRCDCGAMTGWGGVFYHFADRVKP